MRASGFGLRTEGIGFGAEDPGMRYGSAYGFWGNALCLGSSLWYIQRVYGSNANSQSDCAKLERKVTARTLNPKASTAQAPNPKP